MTDLTDRIAAVLTDHEFTQFGWNCSCDEAETYRWELWTAHVAAAVVEAIGAKHYGPPRTRYVTEWEPE
jgi:hypothetical protein